MRSWKAVVKVSLLVLAMPLVASVPRALHAQMIATPAKHLKGPNEGKFPVGWKLLADKGGKGRDSTVLTEMAPGVHIRSGPSALFWSPVKNTGKGTFTATATMYLGPPTTATPVGYGMFFGGKEMGSPNARYTEFLVRNDGNFMVRRHEGAKVVMIHDWSYVAGIGRHGGQYDHIIRNIFRVVVEPTMVTLMCNKVVVITLPRREVAPDGEFGMRIGAEQEMTVDAMGVEGHMPQVIMEDPVFKPKKGVPSAQRRG